MDNVISVLVVEDEEIWSKMIQLVLLDFGYSIARIVNNTEDALTAFSECDYDIILMDINLNGKNSGIELGKVVNKVYKKPFIFITASGDHTLMAAAAAKPSAYLPKPINPSSLFIAIQNAINNFSNGDSVQPDKNDDSLFSSFFVKQGKRYKKIDWKDVSSISAGKNYVSVFNTIDKTQYFIRSSLQRTLQHIIPKYLQGNFIQVNRSEAVQLSFVLEISDDEVKTAYSNIPITESYGKELKSKMNIVI